MDSSHRTERSCIACRRKAEPAAFFRIGKNVSGVISLIESGPSFSRSAYICPTYDCLERAFAKGRISHALRLPLTSEEQSTLLNELQCKYKKRKV